jgi:catechol 2,3-dioxygenase-like lactoylglutathione lyase family enzyme
MPISNAQVGETCYQIPPLDGFTVAHFLTVADIDRSAQFYETIFGARILSRGNGIGAPAWIQIANTWLILYYGGGPTPDKPTVALTLPDPNDVSSFMNIRVADIHASYNLWQTRGADFITPPTEKQGELYCYLRDPDGHLIEIGQSNPATPYT